MEQAPDFSTLLRDWRHRRRRSQLDLALATPVSQRHLSFLESGRSRPSRQTVHNLASALELTRRAENQMLISAGFAPARAASGLDDPALEGIRAVARGMLEAAEPCPALVVDADWTLVDANAMARRLMGGAAPALLAPPINVLRLSLHPDGLAQKILNFREWRAHAAARLTREAELSGNGFLLTLRDELLGYPVPSGAWPGPAGMQEIPVALPLSLATPAGRLDLVTTTTVFGTAAETYTSELVIESFWPATAKDRAVLDAIAATPEPPVA